MAFPTAIPTYAGFTSSHTLSADNHAAQSNAEQGDIIAIASKVGTGSSTPTSGMLLRGTGTGISSWAQVNLTTDVTGVLPTANGGTGTTLLIFPSGSDTLVGRNTTDILINKTLTTPTIGSFANANHDHTNSAGGGQLGTSALSNSSVTANKLSTGVQGASVATAETTTSTSYAQLATATDQVTITVGVNGIVVLTLSAECFNSGANLSLVAYDMSGANTSIASDSNIMCFVQGTNEVGSSATVLLTGLTAGSTTFKMFYRVNAGTGTFERRKIVALPL